MDDLNLSIGVITAITGILTASAAWIANLYIKNKNRREDELKIRNFKREIKSFFLWYKQARPELERLHNDTYRHQKTSEILSNYRKHTYNFDGEFNFWRNNSEEVIMILEKKYKKDDVVKCANLIDDALKFNKLSSYILEVMGKTENKELPYHDFCENFVNTNSNLYIETWGGSFSRCLRNKMIDIENEYKEVIEILELEPSEIVELS